MSQEKKNPPRAQIFRYFRIESRNNNFQPIRNQNEQTCGYFYNLHEFTEEKSRGFPFLSDQAAVDDNLKWCLKIVSDAINNLVSEFIVYY